MTFKIDMAKEKKEYEEILGMPVRRSHFERRIRAAFKVYMFDLRVSMQLEGDDNE